MLLVIIFGRKGKNGKETTVVCTFNPLYVMAENLLEDTGIRVVNMTENLTGCIHNYQLTTKDMKAIDGAAVLLANGSGMESFLDNVKTNYPDVTVIEVAAAHKEVDNPHLWMSTDYEMDCIDYVSMALTKRFPELKEKIDENAEKYGEKIIEGPYEKKLEIAETIENSARSIRCICFNEAFEVFTESMGMSNIAVFSLDENELPSANEVAEAIEKAKRCKEVIILIEKDQVFHSHKISGETGAAVIYIDPLTGASDKDSYIEGMNANLEAIEEYLK
jgi:zinc transport system substrate-binding protein